MEQEFDLIISNTKIVAGTGKFAFESSIGMWLIERPTRCEIRSKWFG